MSQLSLREVHSELGARFTELDGMQAVSDYGDTAAEHAAITGSVAVLDLSFRGRLCLTGADRVRLLHGQVTNDVQRLRTGDGCYAAFTSPKGRLQADVNIYALAQELLLDFEPGLTAQLQARLDHYIVADDVQVVDVAPFYGLVSIQGPLAATLPERLGIGLVVPSAPHGITHFADPAIGDLYLAASPRAGGSGLDLFVPADATAMVFDRLVLAARQAGGRAAGWNALDLARFEAGIPRFGVDMDESNLPPEAGLDRDGISYTKGCYIGQETIARLRTYGQVNRALRGLRLDDAVATLPVRGDKLVRDGREVGYVTGAVRSAAAGGAIALGYVRRECNAPGTALHVRTAGAEVAATVVPLPFVKPATGKRLQECGS
jgi:folate-binding protein YgfZ